MLVGTLYLGYVFDVHHIMSILEYILDHNAKPDIWDYFKAMGVGWLKTIIPFLLVCMFTTILVSWFQSKMQLATEAVWGEMLFLLILYCLGSMIIVLIFDFIAEYFLFMKDMKMDKQEVKREYKEQEGNPEIKSKRRERIRKFFLSN